MPGFLLHTQAPVTCPHAPGKVTVTPGQIRVTVNGDPVVTTLNKLTVAGCPLQVPVPGGTKPQPCVTVVWPNVSARVKVMGVPVLLQSKPGTADGMCQSLEQIPQGPPVLGALLTRVAAQ